MYDSFYELKREPFRLSPDHNMAFGHKRFAKARAYMSYAFMRAEGFVMVTGRPGTGKTTLVGVLKDQLSRDQVVVARLVCTQLQADDLLKLVCYEFGVTAETKDKGELLQQLSRRLKAWDREGRRALLIVDEAQNLTISALEELRLLTNLEVEGRPLLQIFLLGQTELRDLILRPELEQVHQRLVAATHLEPLEQSETEDYIRHRLDSVGWRGNPAISKAVYPLIFKFSEGIPRRINLICSRLFLHGAVEQKDRIGIADMRTVVQELQSEGLAAGSHFNGSDFQMADEFEVWTDPASPFDDDNLQSESVPQAPPMPDAVPTNAPSEQPSSTSSVAINAEKPPFDAIEKPVVEPSGIEFFEAAAVSGDQAPLNSQAAHHLQDAAKCDSASAQHVENSTEAAEEAVDTSAAMSAIPRQSASQDARPEGSLVALKAERSSAQNERFVVGEKRPGADDALAREVEKKDSASWLFALFLLLSLGLVMWAVTGFKLPFIFDGM